MTLETATLGGGCFWCLEAAFIQLNGVLEVISGYCGGQVEQPNYAQVCTGATGHAEVVRVTYDPARIDYRTLLLAFFAIHDPTTPDRQGHDVGSQYRSAIYCYSAEQRAAADATREQFQAALATRGYGAITTEIRGGQPGDETPIFYYAEEYHQQYLAKNPGGYCGLAGTGASCALPTGVQAGL